MINRISSTGPHKSSNLHARQHGPVQLFRRAGAGLLWRLFLEFERYIARLVWGYVGEGSGGVGLEGWRGFIKRTSSVEVRFRSLCDTVVSWALTFQKFRVGRLDGIEICRSGLPVTYCCRAIVLCAFVWTVNYQQKQQQQASSRHSV